jgi:lysophospholipase L1-like esterase
MFLTRKILAVLSVMGLAVMPRALAANTFSSFILRSNDVVAFVGGSDVAAAQHTGHLEALLAVKFPGVRFRNFGWEGDTVFAQRRDVGFPPLSEHLKRAQITVLFIQFGRTEALNEKERVADFLAAYDKLVLECAKQTPRIMLVIPPPFETGGELLPDLSRRNAQLAAHADAVRTLAKRHALPVVDLFAEFGGAAHEGPRLTDNGLQITPRGHALIAAAFIQQLGAIEFTVRPGVKADGAWSNIELERLRQIIV